MNQITQLIAIVALTALSILATLGSWWFAFGLWPVSWPAFVFFALVHLTITALLGVVGTAK